MLNMQPQIMKLMDIAAGPIISGSDIANRHGFDSDSDADAYPIMEQKTALNNKRRRVSDCRGI